MYDLVSVAVFNGADDLLEKLARLGFLQLPVVDDVVEQLTAGVFEDHDNLCWCRYDCVPAGGQYTKAMDMQSTHSLMM